MEKMYANPIDSTSLFSSFLDSREAFVCILRARNDKPFAANSFFFYHHHDLCVLLLALLAYYYYYYYYYYCYCYLLLLRRAVSFVRLGFHLVQTRLASRLGFVRETPRGQRS